MFRRNKSILFLVLKHKGMYSIKIHCIKFLFVVVHTQLCSRVVRMRGINVTEEPAASTSCTQATGWFKSPCIRSNLIFLFSKVPRCLCLKKERRELILVAEHPWFPYTASSAYKETFTYGNFWITSPCTETFESPCIFQVTTFRTKPLLPSSK
jgi:hypothetical protein